MKRFILTGTPGSGKTSLIRDLEKHCHSVIHESATDVIAQAQSKGIARPWEESDFTDNIIHMQKARQINAIGELQFYDRSPFCTYALEKYLSQWKCVEFIPSLVLLAEINRCLETSIYDRNVFFFDNLGFIEHTDARKITYEDALIFEQVHLDVYHQFGFKIIMVPKGTIAERYEFVMNKILLIQK